METISVIAAYIRYDSIFSFNNRVVMKMKSHKRNIELNMDTKAQWVAASPHIHKVHDFVRNE
jgi:uncharacterized protein YbbC (DUF1343 family)